MKPGSVGAVLVVLAGGAAGGALYLNDESQLQRATAARVEGRNKQEQGDLAGATQAWRAAALAAGKVRGVAGKRGQALEVAEEARRELAKLAALEAAQGGRVQALGDLPEAPPGGRELVDAERARRLLVSARRLEDGGLLLVDEAAVAFAEAVQAVERAPAAKEQLGEVAARGHRRVLLQVQVRDAESALRNKQYDEAGRLARAARTTLEAPGSPFEDPARAEALGQRVQALLAELQSHELVATYAAALEALEAKVRSSELGALRDRVRALEAPTLPGGHANAAAHADQLSDLVRQAGRLLEIAEAFWGMVPVEEGSAPTWFIDRHEVSNAAYLAFVQAKGYETEGFWSKRGWRRAKRGDFDDRTGKPGPATWSDGAPPESQADHPVRGLSFAEAQAYAAWAGKQLPTLEQWRRAAAPAGASFPWGETVQDNVANVKDTGEGRTTPVGSYPAGAGPTGALDMIGNVREIVSHEQGFVAVGASYARPAEQVTTPKSTVHHLPASVREEDTGFRCVKELKWDG